MKKINKNSWHYRLADFMGFIPDVSETVRDYRTCIFVTMLYMVIGVGLVHGMIKLILRSRRGSEPIEFFDDKKDTRK